MKTNCLTALFILVGSFLPSQLSATPLFAAGTLHGRVLNGATKEAIVGANVTIPGTAFGMVTDINGDFTFGNIPAGIYQLKVSQIGFNPVVKTDLVVAAGKPTEIVVEINEVLIDVGGVTISADFFQKNVEKPISMQAQGAEEIRRLPGGLEDVVRAVSILPGVAQVDNGRNDLIVRGGAPSENLFLIDNIEVANINHFGTQGATGGPTSFINLDFVSGTEFSCGGFGARYGDRLSSVLSVNLRDGRTDRFGGKATLSASQFGVSGEGPIGEQGSYIVSARRSYLDFIFKAAGFAFVPEYWDFLIKANYELTRNDNITVLSISAIDNVRQFNDTKEKQYGNSQILASSQYQGIAGVSWRHLFKGGFSTVTLGTTYVKFDMRQDDTLGIPLFTNRSTENEISVRGDVVYQLSTQTELGFGLIGKTIPLTTDLFLRPISSIYGEALSAKANYSRTAYKGAVYVQASQSMDRMRVTLGGRADYFNMIKDNFVFAPRLSATYALTAITNLNASVGKYHQAPSYIWIISNAANTDLKFTSVNQAIIGIDHLLRSDVKISLEGYYKEYYDYPASMTRPYLVMANTGAGFGGAEEGFASFGTDPLTSAGVGRARGVELFLQKKSSDVPHYALLSLSYNIADFKGLDGAWRPGNFDQRIILNLGGGYIFNERWEFSGKFRLATGRPFTPIDPVTGRSTLAQYNTSRVVTNHSLDMRIDRRFNFETWNLVAYLDVQNLYNRKQQSAPSWNAYKREVEQTSSIGILPSIGVTAEF
ncbi:MAG: TonB-dependent receptor [Ignavibacteriales bacterium]|nr:TonB-dependent receptor [Ignavibacteriales bacterium]